MKICVYPGSFDPFTNGHLDIIKRAARIFDKVVVGILQNSAKQPFFSQEQRMNFILRSAEDVGVSNIEVKVFSGLLVNFAHQCNANVIVRGLRAVTDFEYELQMAAMNKKLAPDLETVFMMTNTRYSYLSSSIVREIGVLGGCIEGLVPDAIVHDVTMALQSAEPR